MYQSTPTASPTVVAKTPLETTNFFSRLLYLFVNPLVDTGNTRPLVPSDVWPLQPSLTCAAIDPAFTPRFRATRSLFQASLSLIGWPTAVVGMLQLATMLCSLSGPVVLAYVVSAVESATSSDLLVAVAGLSGVKVVQMVLQTQSDWLLERNYVAFSAAVQSLVYEKAMSLRQSTNMGSLSNLFGADLWTLNAVVYQINQVWILPLHVFALLGLLWLQLGAAMLPGIAVLVASFYVNRGIATGQRDNWSVLMTKKDARMQLVTFVFGHMDAVKWDAAETRHKGDLDARRADEVTALWRDFVWRTYTIASNYIAPVVLSTVSFATYVLVLQQPLTASKVFASLALFNTIKSPMLRLPQLVATCMQASVSYVRFETFLGLPERTLDGVTALPPSSDVAIQIERGCFSWDDATSTTTIDGTTSLFQDLNISIPRGHLAVVHGAVGAGKSALCHVVLGNLHKRSGSVGVAGRVAYAGQEPWVQQLSIRDNILFGRPYDPVRYNAVVEACALTEDLNQLDDRTEIKGVTVSGGQKARIALARAVYSDADVYVLDAPFAAVDALVQQEIFAKCILGLLCHKTVLLVTHSQDIIASPHVDLVIEMDAGRVVSTTATTTRGQVSLPENALPPLASFVSPSDINPVDCKRVDATSSPATPLHGNSNEESPLLSTKLPSDKQKTDSSHLTGPVLHGYMAATGGWSVVFTLVVIQTLWQGLYIASVLWLSDWTILTTSFEADAPYHLAVYASLSLASALMVIVRTLVIARAGLRASTSFFDRITSALLHAPLRFFDTTPLGDLLTRFGGDLGQLDTMIPLILSYFFATSFLLLFSLGAIAYALQFISLLLLPLLAVYASVGRVYIRPARDCERLAKAIRSPLLTTLAESIDGATIVRAFGHTHRFQHVHHANVDAVHAAGLMKDILGQWFACRMQLLSASLLLVTTVSLVALRDSLHVGLVGLVFNYALDITTQLEAMVSVWSMLETAMVAPERLLEYAAAPNNHLEQEAPAVLPRDAHLPRPWPHAGAIQFRDVAFRYREAMPLALHDINLDIEAGEKVGVVGRTGAGKSSLIMALFRMNELAAGTITIDGIDTSAVGLHALRANVAIVPQTPTFPEGTVRRYLDPTDSQYSDAELWDVLNRVQLTSHLGELKLQSLIDNGGDNWSLGERQMLCLARALLRRAKVVIFDEATAAIDRATDHQLQQVIRDEFATSTVITIAHRLDSVLACDRIVVLDQGCVVENDAPQVLLKQGSGAFVDLCREGNVLGLAELRNVSILSIENLNLHELQFMNIHSTNITNWAMDNKTFNLLDGLGNKSILKSVSLAYDPTKCTNGGGMLRPLWSSAVPNSSVCVGAGFKSSSAPTSTINVSLIVGLSIGGLVLLMTAIGVFWRKHFIALKVEFQRTVNSTDFSVQDESSLNMQNFLRGTKKLHANVITVAQLQSFVEEIALMSKFDSPRVVKLIGACWTRPRTLKCVMELMDGGDLSMWPPTVQTNLLGLVYLHSLIIIHRDLKSRNILLDSAKGTKLVDFGISKEDEKQTMTMGVGTLRWMAPEVILKNFYTVAADIYSFGMVLSEYDSHQIPFQDLTNPTSGSLISDFGISSKVAAGELRPSFSNHMPVWLRDMALHCNISLETQTTAPQLWR
ncbi:Aste57867_12566 [Aphanomyces stellatus]|uniref:Aste57867_12566 protein n=1 Tax=Aphanomyces stellatus TaxID=120398 RepID=A0A485KWC0_9STRA|nr:hypothetical protein As57867_012520 [Aphanomyces stellatus]VFT89417.1 Aste57867_12566 [Aphanomyces stellatus]